MWIRFSENFFSISQKCQEFRFSTNFVLSNKTRKWNPIFFRKDWHQKNSDDIRHIRTSIKRGAEAAPICTNIYLIYLPSIYAYRLYSVFIVSLNVCLLYASSFLYCHVKLYITGVYFSAHWCPPCRAFTPHLAKKYETWKKAGHPFEIIFVSSDRDQSSFDDYYKEMPWLTVPYDDEERRVIIYFGFFFFLEQFR